jgi:DNA repair protein RecN (Recombination protein N)
MLRELHIANLAIIERVDIELAAGLNVFTGQTGAGKSLILGALELLLGLRGGGEEAALFVRPGSGEARVSGVFEVASADLAERLGQLLDQPLAPREPILVTRRVSAAGRSSASVNGLPVTAAMLREAGQLLVDIHGQHDQQFLLKPANQLLILDAFGDAACERRRFADALRDRRACQQRLRDLRDSEQRRLEAMELYRFQVEEIDKAALRGGEYEPVRNRYAVLKNAAHLKSQSSQVLLGLCEGDDAVLERLAGIEHRVRDLLRVDGSLADLAGRFEQAREALHDAASMLERYQDRLDVDEGELAGVEERLDVLNRLVHKYGKSAAGADADPIDAVLAHRREIGRKLEELDGDTKALAELEGQIARLQAQVAGIGQRLTRLRRQAAKRLKTLVEAEFRDLEMFEATFDVDVRTRRPDDPAVDSSGLDEVEFLVRTNPGQDSLPLRKIASGGEISRIMLALKTILADKDQVAVLIFDEIDANIGDRLGATIGRKMRALAGGQAADGKAADADAAPRCQIVCITHLSQIAACADHHVRIAKEVVGPDDGRQTVATVRVLNGEDRVRELAEMTAGRDVTDAALAHARNLLAAAGAEDKKGNRKEGTRHAQQRRRDAALS